MEGKAGAGQGGGRKGRDKGRGQGPCAPHTCTVSLPRCLQRRGWQQCPVKPQTKHIRHGQLGGRSLASLETIRAFSPVPLFPVGTRRQPPCRTGLQCFPVATKLSPFLSVIRVVGMTMVAHSWDGLGSVRMDCLGQEASLRTIYKSLSGCRDPGT